MTDRDDTAATNRQYWERMVSERQGFTRPWLELDRDILLRYASGTLEPIPEPLIYFYPSGLLADVEGSDVLCLGSGVVSSRRHSGSSARG